MNIVISLKDEVLDLERLPGQVASLLSEEEPERSQELETWTKDWLEDRVPGDKMTVVHLEGDHVIGVIRFWSTPHVNDAWYLEGLQIRASRRNQGIGTAMVTCGLKYLKAAQVAAVYVNVHKDNLASIRVHEKAGFQKLESVAINSFGDVRPQNSYYVKTL